MIIKRNRIKIRSLYTFSLIVGLFAATGIVVSQSSQSVLELMEMIQTILIGRDLLSDIYLVVISGGALGSGIGIVVGSTLLYRRKRAKIESKLS